MTGHSIARRQVALHLIAWGTFAILFLAVASCDRQSSPDDATNQLAPEITLEVTVLDDGTATSLWTAGIAISIGENAAKERAREISPLSPQALAWLEILRESIPRISVSAGELATLFDVPPLDAIVAVGNRGSSDAFGWTPIYIGINVQAFADTYGPPTDGASDRMIRIVAHEYLHLLTYAAYPYHREYRQTPFDRALWTMFFEGIGDYVSVSKRWLPDEQGQYSTVTANTLKKLEPIFVERLELLAIADEQLERESRVGISMGKFDEKWGSLPIALWLHSEVKRCGKAPTLRAALRLERDAVLLLALNHASPELKPRIMALQDRTGRISDGNGDRNTICLASVYETVDSGRDDSDVQ